MKLEEEAKEAGEGNVGIKFGGKPLNYQFFFTAHVSFR